MEMILQRDASNDWMCDCCLCYLADSGAFDLLLLAQMHLESVEKKKTRRSAPKNKNNNEEQLIIFGVF